MAYPYMWGLRSCQPVYMAVSILAFGVDFEINPNVRMTKIDWGVFQMSWGTVGRPAPAGKKERSGRSPDRASDVFSTEMKHTQLIDRHIWGLVAKKAVYVGGYQPHTASGTLMPRKKRTPRTGTEPRITEPLRTLNPLNAQDETVSESDRESDWSPANRKAPVFTALRNR